MSRYFNVLLFFLILNGCASSGSKKPQLPEDEKSETVAALDQALEDLAVENYTSAASKLERLSNGNPISELDLVILYNLGVAKEGLRYCEESVQHYRSVARVANNKFDRVAALALYRLGFAYDCLGDPKKSVLAFLDAQKKSRFLPLDVAEAELPARLAAGYASIGRKKEALFYFNEASSGLKKILAHSSGKSGEVLAAKTMYAMGKLSRTSDALIFARMLNMQQAFLLQATEMRDGGGSSMKAKNELKAAYRRIQQEKIDSKEKRHAFFVECLKAARQLKKLRLPSSRDRTEDLFRLVDQVESYLQNNLATMSETVKKTSQEKKRRSLKKGL